MTSLEDANPVRAFLPVIVLAVLLMSCSQRNESKSDGTPQEEPEVEDFIDSKYHLVQKGWVANFRFYETGAPYPDVSDREYRERFPKVSTRFICWEVEFGHPKAARRIELKIDFKIADSPPTEAHISGSTESYIDEGWEGSYHTECWGWPEPGNWPTGSFIYEIYIENKAIAYSSFEVH